jgi:hypothetical protein
VNVGEKWTLLFIFAPLAGLLVAVAIITGHSLVKRWKSHQVHRRINKLK